MKIDIETELQGWEKFLNDYYDFFLYCVSLFISLTLTCFVALTALYQVFIKGYGQGQEINLEYVNLDQDPICDLETFNEINSIVNKLENVNQNFDSDSFSSCTKKEDSGREDSFMNFKAKDEGECPEWDLSFLSREKLD